MSPGSPFDPKQSSSAAPRKVLVKSLVESRYADNARPADWDMRKEGLDKIVTEEGEELLLLSDGQQSPPQAGWSLILTGGERSSGFRWTLYGLPPAAGQTH